MMEALIGIFMPPIIGLLALMGGSMLVLALLPDPDKSAKRAVRSLYRQFKEGV